MGSIYLLIRPYGRDQEHYVGPFDSIEEKVAWLDRERFNERYGERHYRFADQFWAHEAYGVHDPNRLTYHPTAWPHSKHDPPGGDDHAARQNP